MQPHSSYHNQSLQEVLEPSNYNPFDEEGISRKAETVSRLNYSTVEGVRRRTEEDRELPVSSFGADLGTGKVTAGGRPAYF
jgi:hypothetical protein